jgi:hypothetical protein
VPNIALAIMRSRRYLTALLLCVNAALAVARDFTIEDEILAALPPSVEAAIRAEDSTDFVSCRLIGKPIGLSGEGTLSGYVATTANACGWGASLGPIWIVRVTKTAAQLVLSDRGYSLTLGKGKQNGLRHVAISGGTAGWYAETLWKYNGTAYKEAASYNFNADDEATCKKHPKICPWQY